MIIFMIAVELSHFAVAGTDHSFQRFPGKKDPAFHRAQGKLEGVGDLLVFVSLIMHQEGYPDAVVQTVQHAVKFLHHHVGSGIIVHLVGS